MTGVPDTMNIAESLSLEQVGAVLDAVPLELTVIDANDVIIYWNKVEDRKSRIPRSVHGTDVRDCHRPSSLPAVEAVISQLRAGTKDVVEKALPDGRVTWHALRGPDDRYLGTLEVIQRVA